MVSPAEMCHWLILSDMYGVVKIREYCLDAIACNFETFAEAPVFRALLLTLPPPSGDSSLRTTAPSAPGSGTNNDQGNLLDDLREKWLEIEAAELHKRDQSALLFDKRLEMLVVVVEQEKFSNEGIMSPQLFLVVGISMAITPWLAACDLLIANRFDLHDVCNLLHVESEFPWLGGVLTEADFWATRKKKDSAKQGIQSSLLAFALFWN